MLVTVADATGAMGATGVVRVKVEDVGVVEAVEAEAEVASGAVEDVGVVEAAEAVRDEVDTGVGRMRA